MYDNPAEKNTNEAGPATLSGRNTKSAASKPQAVLDRIDNERSMLDSVNARLNNILIALSGPFPESDRPVPGEEATMGLFDMMLKGHEQNTSRIDRALNTLNEICQTLGLDR